MRAPPHSTCPLILLTDLDLFTLRAGTGWIIRPIFVGIQSAVVALEYPVDCGVFSIRISSKIALEDTPFGMATLLAHLMGSFIHM